MAKGQSRKPGRDVRGGSGKRAQRTSGQVGKGPKGGGKGGDRRNARQRQAKGGVQRRGAGSSSGADLIFGRHAVQEALAAGMPLRSAFALDASAADSKLNALAAAIEETGVSVERVSRPVLDAMSEGGAHQGVVVRARPFEYASLPDVIRAAGEGDALVLVLDHVSDQGNLGAIVRSAEVVGAAGVVVANARAAGVGAGAYKASAGAVLHLPVAQVPNLSRALDDLKEAGFWCCAASEHAEQDVWSAPVGGRLALVMGSEGTGVSQLLLKKCDFACRLPQRGVTESLNVAQAATVLCYEWLRRVSGHAET